MYDDNRGVVEPLNETGQYGEGLIIRGKHVVILDDLKSSTYLHRMIGEGMMLEPQIAFAVSSKSFVDIKNNYNLMVRACLTYLHNAYCLVVCSNQLSVKICLIMCIY